MYEKEEQWFCQNDTESVEWLTVFQIILQKQAKSYTGSRGNDQSCTGNELYTRIAGQTIFFCIQDSRLVYIDHAGTRATVTEWNARPFNVIKLPQQLEKCNAVYPNISLLEDAMSLADSFTTKSGKSLLKRKPKKHCLFVHGAGEHPETDRYMDMPELLHYWGHIERYTPQCLTRRFMWYNSINRGWDDTESHKMFCEFAIGNSSRPISHSMVFTHSMGNLVVAAAFHRRFCKFDHSTSEWYSIQAPWRGSKVSKELYSLCSKKNLETKITYIVLKELHYCDVNKSRPAQAYMSMNTSYVSPTGVSYKDLIRTARRYISGAVCGNSAFGMGLSLSMSARLHLVSAYTHLPLPNDGLVAFDSCNITGSFENKPTANYYSGHFNHAEGTCRFGERRCFTTSNQHPCQWYSKN
ncbi:uncharacterized protein LOC110440616 [Mizuhopecten yessoensis]|uniref:Uncharacterized protein n=1 Tax=Mizuhopecten yessoensis TaxID=6573 RepID=A0A210PKT0_MIZYE|nr:uncharacterized protein LOC110440616 [Mizuhopecten yessoensis]XP_021339448.1 uncharacterized protein LOC110440616 [Mizuhopecten yessoensis]OWF37098.1 hypothetical protein KP79_PYT09789 [Mizuhopecten yessoensis]